MITTDQVQNLLDGGGSVVDSGGGKVGTVEQVFLDDQTGNPEWATVTFGMFGGAQSFVPIANADVQGDQLVVPFDKSTIKDAPRMDDSSTHLSQEQESELYSYYGMSYSDTPTPEAESESAAPQGRSDLAEQPGIVGQDTSGPTTDQAMTRSEEQLRVGTETREAGKVRLRKYVVTETVTDQAHVDEDVRKEQIEVDDAAVADPTHRH